MGISEASGMKSEKASSDGNAYRVIVSGGDLPHIGAVMIAKAGEKQFEFTLNMAAFPFFTSQRRPQYNLPANQPLPECRQK